MSLKPKKHSDVRKMKEKMKVKTSKMDTLHELPTYTMIVSEGIKTEPLYLKGFVSKINEKYKSISKEPHIQVYGTARNTQGLIRFVDKMVMVNGSILRNFGLYMIKMISRWIILIIRNLRQKREKNLLWRLLGLMKV